MTQPFAGLDSLSTSPSLWLVSNDFREWLLAAGLSEKTIRTYELRIRQTEALLGRVGSTIERATPSEIRMVSESLPRGSSTQRQLKSALKHYYEMVDRHRPPHRAVRVPKKPEPKNRALEPDQAARMAKAARSWYPEGTAVMLGLYMALRASEIASFSFNRLSHDSQWYTVFGKGDRTHTLPVHPILETELSAVRRFVKDEWLFPGSRGRDYVTTQTIWNWVRAVGEEAGVGEIHPHQLRHTALTTANDSTGDLRSVSKFARHRDVRTTQVYTRTTDDQLRRVMLAIEY